MSGASAGGGFCQRPEAHLGNRVSCKLGRQLSDPLVEHVDDHRTREGLARSVASGLRRLGGEGLDKLEGRTQVGTDVAVPTLGARRADRVMLEDRSVVDEDIERFPQRRRRRGHQGGGIRPVEQVRRDDNRPPAAGRDLRGQRVGGLAAAVAVDRDGEATGGEAAGHRGTEPLRTACHEGCLH